MCRPELTRWPALLTLGAWCTGPGVIGAAPYPRTLPTVLLPLTLRCPTDCLRAEPRLPITRLGVPCADDPEVGGRRFVTSDGSSSLSGEGEREGALTELATVDGARTEGIVAVRRVVWLRQTGSGWCQRSNRVGLYSQDEYSSGTPPTPVTCEMPLRHSVEPMISSSRCLTTADHPFLSTTRARPPHGK